MKKFPRLNADSNTLLPKLLLIESIPGGGAKEGSSGTLDLIMKFLQKYFLIKLFTEKIDLSRLQPLIVEPIY